MTIETQNDREDERAAQPRVSLALWVGMLGAPVVWLMQFQVRYALASAPPGTARHGVMIAAGVVAMMAIAVLAGLSWRHWRVANASPLDRMAAIGGRNRFMAALGLMNSALFFLVTAAQMLADVFIPPGKL